jgi:hypothetical protein
MLLIGLGHEAQHGKDTFAAAVKAAYGSVLNIRLTSFADPLRLEVREAATNLWKEQCGNRPFEGPEALRMLCKQFDLPYEEDAPVDADYPWGKQRVLHQWWGTELRRDQDPEYWVKQAALVVKKAREDGVHALLFRDLRFHNEFDFLGDEEGYRLKIQRIGYISKTPQHISETQLAKRDFDLRLAVHDGHLALLKIMSIQMFGGLLTAEPPTGHKLDRYLGQLATSNMSNAMKFINSLPNQHDATGLCDAFGREIA